jgi:hypothetical protein
MRRRLRYWLAVLLSLAALAGGAVLAYRTYRAATSARGVVSAYFAALQRGDAAAALGLGDVSSGPHELLTPAVLRAQLAVAPIAHVRVGADKLAGSHGTVHVTYVIAFPAEPQQVADDVPVVRRGGAWRLQRSAIVTTLSMPAASDRADILGKSLPLGDPVSMFPGAVPVHFDTPYLEASAVQDFVTFATGDSLSVGVQVSAAGRRALVGIVERALRSCLTTAHPDPACPLPDDTYVPGTLHGTPPQLLDKDLDINLAPDAAGLLDVSGLINVDASYDKLSYANVAQPGHGSVTLDVEAHAYAVAPLKLAWSRP